MAALVGAVAYWICGVSWAAAAAAGITETAAAHCRLGDNTCGALAGVCGSVGLRLIAIDEMVMAFSYTFVWGGVILWLLRRHVEWLAD